MLTVVGTGIAVGLHLTPEARAAWESAEDALFLVGDPVAAALLTGLNPRARSLQEHYRAGRPRLDAYEAMVEEILSPVRAGHDVCTAFYGHPGFFVYPGHEAVRRARREGFEARLLPGIRRSRGARVDGGEGRGRPAPADRRAARLRADEDHRARLRTREALRGAAGAGARTELPTLGDVDSPQALESFQAAKRAYKASMKAARAG